MEQIKRRLQILRLNSTKVNLSGEDKPLKTVLEEKLHLTLSMRVINLLDE